MSLHVRALIALDRLRSTLDYRAAPNAEHALALALETMFRTGDSRSFLTAPEVERYVGGRGRNGDRIIRRLLDAGALVEVTDPASVDAFRAVVPDSTAPSGARVVTLPEVAIEAPTTAECVAIEARTHTGEVAIEAPVAPGEVAIEVQILDNSLSLGGKELVTSYNYAREGGHPEGYVRAMAPRSVVWHGSHLGSQAARVYGVVASSPRPVTPAVVCSVLSIGNKGAKDVLRNLGKHRLIRRADDGSGWIPGPITPESHDAATCPECPSPVSSPSEAVETAHRPSQPQTEPSMTECPDCQSYAEHGLPCPCDSTPVGYVATQPITPPAAPRPWGWDITGRPITGPNGEQDVWRLNGRDLDWVDGRTGTIRKPSVGPGGCPPVVWEAFKKEKR